MEKNNLEPSGQGVVQPTGEEPEGQGGDTAKMPEPGGGEPAPLGTVDVLGRKYDLSKPDQVQALIKDYTTLGSRYTPLTQQLAELEKIVQGFKEKPQADFSDPETVEYLRKIGFIHRDEMSQKEKEMSQKEEDKALESTLQELEKAYDGKDGKPKFNREAVLGFCITNGISSPEHGYNLLNWNALKEWELRQAKAAPAAPPSSGGEGGQRQPQPKKRVFGPVGEDEVSLREAMLETLEQGAPTPTT